jgi:uncharacterized cupredoxin-like copper-binding protein
MRQRFARSALVGLAVMLSACGSDSSDVGESAPAGEATRTVEVTITAAKQYQPASLTVAPGEVVTFKVTNASGELHEFMMGDASSQQKHDKEMAAMGTGSMKMADQPDYVDIDPGQTKQLTWKFPDKSGATVIYGSHVPGDYAGGLKGTIAVGG